MNYVTDTHPVAWFLEDDARLSPAARNALEDRTAQIIIPTIVLAEIKFLYSRGRISIDVPAVMNHVNASANCVIYPLDETVVNRLPATLDIHDAIIVATALVYREDLGESVTLITRDTAITASGLVPTVW